MVRGGKTWWGARFMDALASCMDEGRLQRGRSYDAEGRRRRFAIVDGEIAATIRGNVNPYFGVYKTPHYKVEIRFEKIPAATWSKILKRLGSNAAWVTHLVLGEVPPTIEDALEDSKVKLLPRSRSEIRAQCSCPDYASTCKHIGGVYFHVASLLDRDPLLLFEFRGLPRKKLLEAMERTPFGAALLHDSTARAPDLAAAVRESRFPVVEAVEATDADTDPRAFWRGQSLPRALTEDRRLPPTAALLLRRAGDYPEFWNREASFLEAMEEVYSRVAKGLPTEASEGPPIDMSR